MQVLLFNFRGKVEVSKFSAIPVTAGLSKHRYDFAGFFACQSRGEKKIISYEEEGNWRVKRIKRFQNQVIKSEKMDSKR